MALHERADGLVVVNDSYNANPASMNAALDALAAIGERGEPADRRGARGDARARRDRRPSSTPRSARTRPSWVSTSLVTVGAAAEAIADGARRTPGWDGEAVPTAGREQAADWLRHNVVARDVVLVKASRGAALEHLADVLVPRCPGQRSRTCPSTGPRNRKAGLRADEGDSAGRRSRPGVLAARHPGGDPALHAARLRPGDPRRRPDQPPHQARHPHHGRRRDHRVDGPRLLPGRR